LSFFKCLLGHPVIADRQLRKFVLTSEHINRTAVQNTEWQFDFKRKYERTPDALWPSTTATPKANARGIHNPNERECTPMGKIKEFYEEEIFANAAKNPNPIPNGTQIVTADPDFASYFKWMDEEIESLVKAVDRG
jgi:hypothetical protein